MSGRISLQRAAEHHGDVRLLVALGQLDRLGEVVLLEELRELRGELAGLGCALRRYHHFCTAMDSDHTDMIISVYTMPLAKAPIVW